MGNELLNAPMDAPATTVEVDPGEACLGYPTNGTETEANPGEVARGAGEAVREALGGEGGRAMPRAKGETERDWKDGIIVVVVEVGGIDVVVVTLGLGGVGDGDAE